MIWLRPSHDLVFLGRAATATIAIVFASLCAQSQSRVATPMAGCPPLDQPPAITTGQSNDANRLVETIILGIRQVSFPELARLDLRVQAFRSRSDYFQTRFSLSRFLLLMRMRYFVEVNSDWLQAQAPPDGVCAILAHELAHVVSLAHGNRIRRFSLVRLLSRHFTAKFERATDLEAIHRGYADGMVSYRDWVYLHVPPARVADKRRNYFSPEEIRAIENGLRERPDLYEYWRKHVPMNPEEILRNEHRSLR